MNNDRSLTEVEVITLKAGIDAIKVPVLDKRKQVRRKKDRRNAPYFR